MSMDSAREFINRIKNDDEFRKKFEELPDEDAFFGKLKAEGFDCTAEDFKELSKELNEEDLDNIAGGGALSRDTPLSIVSHALL